MSDLPDFTWPKLVMESAVAEALPDPATLPPAEYQAAVQAEVDENTRWPLALARRYAEWLKLQLLPGCARIVVAGSVRREKELCGDIELVCEAHGVMAAGGQTGLFDGAHPTLAGELARLERAGALLPRAANNGSKARKFFLETRNAFPGWKLYPRLKVDLFVVTPPAQFGPILAIRTGPADYSKWLVTGRAGGGACPDGWRFKDGALWEGDKPLLTPDEETLFRLLGLRYVDPQYRKIGAGQI